MSVPENSDQRPPKRASIPLWGGFVGAMLVWEVLPWAISRMMPRYGWAAGRPGAWNWLGLIPIAVGTTGLIWALRLHSAQTPGKIDFEEAKTYLLTDGLYRYSRNPMYFAELTLLCGWVIFYGSVAVLIAWVTWWAFFSFYQIPREERIIEAHFGESYREYKRRVPRWIGKPRGGPR